MNPFPDLDHPETLKSVQQKYCTSCGMPLILLGRYLPQKILGKGGFGAAFLARDRYTPGMRRCVVKQFQPSHTLSRSQLQVAQELFEREAQALEDLGNTHPQIPDLFAFFDLTVPGGQPTQQERFFYLVQEFIDGQTMEEELEQKGTLTPDEVLEVLQEILKVLQFVHGNGSIHRDIKLSNIMRNQKGRIYLLDFGAVRQATKGGEKSTGIYSEGFAPPEQINGGEVYPSSDLYALAVTCIMLLTGKQPKELFDSYHNTWNWQQYVPSVGNPLAQVLDRMLHLTPSQRFQSATDALAALSPVPGGSVPRAPGATRSPASSGPTVASAGQSPPTVPPAATSVSRRSAIAPFSVGELLAGAGFTGFEAGLLGIAVASLLGTSLLSGGFWLLLLVGLIVAQSRRIIERIDLLILAGATLALVLLIAPLRQIIGVPIGGSLLITILVIAGFTALVAIAIMALFQLIFKIISKFL